MKKQISIGSIQLMTLLITCLGTVLFGQSRGGGSDPAPSTQNSCMYIDSVEETAHQMTKQEKTDDEWRTALTPEQYRVLREKGTERPFTGKYYHNEEKGMYVCAGCGEELFLSDAKYDSGSGWPSFFAPAADGSVATQTDSSYGMVRAEVTCSRCGGHLGHVFDDGPKPTGLRYCINSASLNFRKKE